VASSLTQPTRAHGASIHEVSAKAAATHIIEEANYTKLAITAKTYPDLSCEQRPSDSHMIERIWRSFNEHGGQFISIAQIHSSIVFSRYKDRTMVAVRGPETRATPCEFPPGALEFFGIEFKPGVFLLDFPAFKAADRNDINLPLATYRSFWIGSAAWEIPTFENVDIFVHRLAREGLLVHNPLVEAILTGKSVHLSQRTMQRQLAQATGLTLNAFRQIERARKATILLKQNLSAQEVAFELGFFDQAHMIRSLHRFIGLTPSRIADSSRTERLSFLYNN